jgi:deazaflavin-dependent oxidoreductase (nitroreductase family)
VETLISFRQEVRVEQAERKLPSWMADHMRRYLETKGEDGHIWNGVPTLLLTTWGRKSGRALMVPLIYGKDGDRFVVVASKGGAPQHPGWYLNICANAEIEVQVAADVFKAHARTATADERPKLWKLMTSIWPQYDEYQERTDREIPVVLIERS